MKKEFTKFEIAIIKRTAQNANQLVTKKKKIIDKINSLEKELESLNDMLEKYEAPIKAMTGGYTTEDLVTKVVEDTGKTDKLGHPIKTTKYVLTYPDTVVPVVDNTIDDTIAESHQVPVYDPSNVEEGPDSIIDDKGITDGPVM